MITSTSNREGLILSYLDQVNHLLRAYAASTAFELDDLRQDASIVIMRCLDERPEQANIAYIMTSVRYRIIDKIRKAKRQETLSLDAPINDAGEDAILTLADFVPDRANQTEPLEILVLREQIETFVYEQAARDKKNRYKRALGTISRHQDLVDTVLASLSLDLNHGQEGAQL